MRALIVDDEPRARCLLRDYCLEHGGLEVVGESCDGHEALVDIRRWRPELVFLDIEMPGLDGFEVLARLADHAEPLRVIFTTGFERYAVQAYEVAAIDYLLKPFDRERFHTAVNRVFAMAPTAAAPELTADPGPLLVRSGSTVRAVAADEVRWIEAAGDYARVHTAAGVFLATSGLGALEGRLDRSRFLRVHRSVVVYLPAVRKLRPRRQGGWIAELNGGASVPVGRKYVAGLKERFV